MSLMMLGPFIFSIPTFAYEGLQRTVSGRVESQMVIGAPPPTHLLGPGVETISLTSTFYPFHMNGAGLAQLRGLQEATRNQVPLMMVNIGGMIFGRWVISEVGESHEYVTASGAPQKVDVDLSLTQYNGGGGGGFNLFGLELF